MDSMAMSHVFCLVKLALWYITLKFGFINKVAHYVLSYIESYFMILIMQYIYINSYIPVRNIHSYNTSIITRQ